MLRLGWEDFAHVQLVVALPAVGGPCNSLCHVLIIICLNDCQYMQHGDASEDSWVCSCYKIQFVFIKTLHPTCSVSEEAPDNILHSQGEQSTLQPDLPYYF